MPIEPVTDKKRKHLIIELDFPGRKIKAKVWKAQVGRMPLYYLDTDIEENALRDREITDRLYDSETRERIEQEIVLGTGGVKMLEALSITPSVFHLNEGHSAFLLIERIANLIKKKHLDFGTAREVVRSSTVFTTHTPVPAGNDRFEKVLIENYFRDYIGASGIPWEQFWDLGHVFAGENTPFDMTVCALKLSHLSNGVSRLHGSVSRAMWQKLWPGFITEEIPISHITNGVHLHSWIAEDCKNILETFAGIDWDSALCRPEEWDQIDKIPDESLYRSHRSLKNQLFDHIKTVVQKNWTREGEDPFLLEKLRTRLNPSALTIGFARRFASYKRPTLLLKDMERLKQIINDEKYPVQFVFAGKAHPADKHGASLIQEIIRLSKTDEFLGSIIFLENYNIHTARMMLAGVDVWLNTPIRPNEASGTSGMKASFNGVLNCSILDGWWDEAYTDGTNGWAIGDRTVYENYETQDLVDAENLYLLIEEKIKPLYYRRNSHGIPVDWVGMMKNAIRSVIPFFNTDRMVSEYVEKLYEPTAQRSRDICADNFGKATALAEWRRKIPNRFSTVHINDINVDGIRGDTVGLGERVKVHVTVAPGMLNKDELLAELVVQDLTKTDNEPYCFIGRMQLAEESDNLFVFEGDFRSQQNGQFRYGIRLIPVHPHIDSKYSTGLVIWS